MTIEEINKRRRFGDIAMAHYMSGIPYRTIEHILNGERSSDTNRGRQVIKWFATYLERRDSLLKANNEIK